ncbi:MULTISPECIES: carbohydrate ABC transporter permease [Clostridium]|uniref:carbohydrate ABC transporter permease n=1 Tax=Clostridium TaxID=1485 RepID=UPI000CF87807|nr:MULTISPECIES: carbohydrate ABC transporter permease [Clostridium]AVK49777.1 sugar ABC transporter permease [Clostridium sp. MF28]NOW88026.1 raffinose/stachyose/melibiose transport system permease protein [Clostridium beijerinckii]PSM56980.1 sugar ABC transporter permease [Clostridium diolis]
MKIRENSSIIRLGIGKIPIQIFLIIVAIIQIYPLIWLVLFSFKDNGEIFGGNIAGLPHVWRIENYESAIKQANVMKYFFNSVIVTVITIVLVLLLSSMTAYAISRMKWKLSKPTLIIILIGMMVPIHAALLPLFMVLKNLKMLNSYWALIIPYTAFAIPMAVIILAAFIRGIPKELEEAAVIDGCGIFRIFFSIIIPIIRPAMATVAIFTYLSSWNELMFAVTFINKAEFKTLTVGIMSMVGNYVTKWGDIGAGLVIATIPTILIYILLSDQVQKSLTAGAVKE